MGAAASTVDDDALQLTSALVWACFVLIRGNNTYECDLQGGGARKQGALLGVGPARSTIGCCMRQVIMSVLVRCTPLECICNVQ